jgi:hypothetical protein
MAANATIINNANFQIGRYNALLPANPPSGVLSGSAVFTNNGTFYWNRGNVVNVAKLQNYGQMNLLNDGPLNPAQLNSSLLTNYHGGVMTWTGFNIQMTSGLIPIRRA